MDLTALSLVPALVTSETTALVTIRLPDEMGIEATSATSPWIATEVAELSRSP